MRGQAVSSQLIKKKTILKKLIAMIEHVVLTLKNILKYDEAIKKWFNYKYSLEMNVVWNNRPC